MVKLKKDEMKGGNEMEKKEESNNDSSESGSLTFKKSTLWKVGTFVFLGLFLIALFTGGFGGILHNSSTGNTVNNGNTGGNTQAPSGSGNIQLPTIDANTPVLGDKNAPITVYEFTDFSCPFCAAASGDDAQMVAYMQQSDSSWKPIISNLMNDYINKGKVKLAVYYAFGHSGGHAAQNVAWCLNDQGLYWKFYPKAFAAFDSTKSTQDVEDLDKMKTLAQSIGADMTKLNSCLSSNKYASRFDTEQNEASAAGFQGTPYFVLANSAGKTQTVSGAVSYSSFEATLKTLQ